MDIGDVALPDTWHLCGSSARTGWPGVSMFCPGVTEVRCSLRLLCVAASKSFRADPSMRHTLCLPLERSPTTETKLEHRTVFTFDLIKDSMCLVCSVSVSPPVYQPREKHDDHDDSRWRCSWSESQQGDNQWYHLHYRADDTWSQSQHKRHCQYVHAVVVVGGDNDGDAEDGKGLGRKVGRGGWGGGGEGRFTGLC